MTTPSRTGKSTLVSRNFPVWLLMRDPDSELILKAYDDQLTEEHSVAARALIAEHRDLPDLELTQDKAPAGHWRMQGRRRGMLAGGILSAATGFGAIYLIRHQITVSTWSPKGQSPARETPSPPPQGPHRGARRPGAAACIAHGRAASNRTVGRHALEAAAF